MRMADYLCVQSIRTDVDATDKESALRVLAELVATEGLDADSAFQVFVDRERIATTAVGSGVAIPHGRLEVEGFRMAMAICPGGVPFDSIDGQPANIVLAVIAPEQQPGGQLKLLARISRVLRDAAVRDRLLAARSSQDVLDIVVEEEARH
jgi:PTS system nitrogen regulatory IIA component